MRIRSAVVTIASLVMLGALAGGQEPVKPTTHPRIVTATRWVTLFTGLEKQLLGSIQQKDAAGIDRFLMDSFEIWMPGGDPVSREEWSRAILGGYTLKSFRISQMSVRDFGDTEVVKFMRSQQAEFQGKDDSGDFFVVDIWRKAGDGWKLSDRYVAKVGPSSSSLPLPEAKPTGKE